MKYKIIRFILFFISILFLVFSAEYSLKNRILVWIESPTFAAQALNAEQLVKQGIEQYNLGKFQEAIAFWKQALIDYQTSSNTDQEAEVLTYLGLANFSLRDYRQALEYYQKALGIFRQSQESDKMINLLEKIGIIYHHLAEYTEAIQAHQQQLNLARQLNQPLKEAAALGNLAINQKALGSYRESRQNLQQALELIQPLSKPKLEAQLWINLGNTEEILGQYNKSREAYQKSLEIAEEINNLEIQGIALGHLGILEANRGQFESAIEFYQKSLNLAQKIGDREGIGHLLNNLGLAYLVLEKIPEAEATYQQSLEIAESLNHQRMKIAALGNLGVLYERLQDYSKAIEYQKQTLELAESLNLPQEQARTLNNLAYTLFKSNQLEEAENKLRNALNILDQLRDPLQDADKVSLFDTQASSYNLLQQVLIAQQQSEAALEVSEWGRTRAFVELLIQKSVQPQTYLSQQTKPPTLAQIKQIAQTQNATLVEYSIIPKDDFIARGKQRGDAEELYIWIIQPDGKITFRSVQLDSLDISFRFLVAKTYLAISQGESNNSRIAQLYQLLIEPIADRLPNDPTKRVIFVPQGELFLVPFAALQNTQGQYLIEQHTILSAPSIQVLASTHQRRQQINHAGRTPLVVGNPKPMPSGFQPLPGAETEAQTIATILKTQPFLGETATETTIRKHLKNASIIHLATHGIFDAEEPLKGAIALAPDQKDGLLTAQEILNLGYRLNAKLVVLSACDTGRGQITGDGIIGLSRALLAAGIPSAIVSLWPVPDQATAELMPEFYRAWQQNPDFADALRQAMLVTLKTYPEPKHWGAFTLIGEGR